MSIQVEVVTGPLEGLVFSVAEGHSLSLGRRRQNDIVLAGDPWISSAHAVLKLKGNQLQLMDLGSSNGSFINGEKSGPKQWININEFFILGSTLLLAGQSLSEYAGDALSWEHPEASFYRQHDLIKEARNIAKASHCNLIGSVHLLQAAMSIDRDYCNERLLDFSTDISSVEKKLKNWKLFQGSREWINGFLVYQYQRRQEKEVLITPMAQQLVSEIAQKQDGHLLDLMLDGPYNLLYPLIGLDTPMILNAPQKAFELPPTPPAKPPRVKRDYTEIAPSPPRPSKAPTSLSDSHEHSDAFEAETGSHRVPSIITPRLREMLHRSLKRSPLLLLCGEPRTGKSRLLAGLTETRGPLARQGRRTKILDPRAFLAFHEPSDYNHFMHELNLQLDARVVLVIDHASWLLTIFDVMDQSLADWLDRAVAREFPVVLCTNVDQAEDLRDLAPDMEVIHLSRAAGKVTRESFLAVCNDLEIHFGLCFSPSAMRHLETAVINKMNIADFHHFLDTLIHACRNEPFEKPRQAQQLTERYVLMIFNQWSAGSNAPTQPPQKDDRATTIDLSEEAKDSGTVKVTDHFAEEVERIIHRFIREHLLGAISYSDGSPAMQVTYELDTQAKSKELNEHLHLLLESVEPAFATWFSDFLDLLDPEQIRRLPECQVDLTAAWKQFCRRFEAVDPVHAKSQFLDEIWKTMRQYLPRP